MAPERSGTAAAPASYRLQTDQTTGGDVTVEPAPADASRAGDIAISVFTCTYDRAGVLGRVYDSLRAQDFGAFEWIVFDNGSSDDTRDRVRRWQREARFPITLMHWEDNCGIQLTYNRSQSVARGTFWLNLDSDDECVPNALTRLHALWLDIPEAERDGFAGVTASCVDQHGRFVGDRFPEDPLDCSSLEQMYRYKVGGEKWGMTRVDLLQRFPFPEVADHVNAGIVWRSIARRYRTRFSNETLRVYYVDEEGREDQLSQHMAFTSHNAYGRWLNSRDTLDRDMDWFARAPVHFIKQAAVYTWFARGQGKSLRTQLGEVRPALAKALVAAAWPVTTLLGARYARRAG